MPDGNGPKGNSGAQAALEHTTDPVEFTKKQLRRPRRRRRPQEQRALDGKKPVRHHDLLVIPAGKNDDEEAVLSEQEIYRFPVVKLGGQANQGDPDGDAPTGRYVDSPEVLDFHDYAQRRTTTVARPQDWGAQRGVRRGPAFGTLPVKREPAATSCAACFLVDSQNVNFANAWTAEEWNAFVEEDFVDLDAAPMTDAKSFEALIAGPRGKVFHLSLELATGEGASERELWESNAEVPLTSDGGDHLGFVRCLNLRYETEIWNQLRNGCVAGSALLHEHGRVVPLVNITSLMPLEQKQGEAT
jgi:hypothetical protein